ncbi:MAG: RluA family pseudouridine synthase [Gammaproteobacteria bacterium]|nr:RluA family pseudouridine synthase [Gammaproteobacteria bacterium]
MTNKPSEQAVQHIEVDPDRDGQRLDNFLTHQLRGVPRTLIYRILRTGQVRVNMGRVKPGYRLQAGDVVRIPPVRCSERVPLNPEGLETIVADLKAAVLWENADFLVLNKPARIAVHGGSGLRYGLIEALKAAGGAYSGLELVHRLDRETSGCLLLAKTRPCLNQLHTLLREHKIEKYYNALLQGEIRQAITVDAALVQRQRGGERVMSITANQDERNKSAVTHIEPLRLYPDLTLAKIQIDTGRTHQIRVHCASIGHPLAGDEKYGNREFNKSMRALGLKRLFLHAAELRFTLAETYNIDAPLPAELTAVLEVLNAKK